MVSVVSGGFQQQYESAWKMKVTGSTPLSGGVLPRMMDKPFSDQLLARETALFQSLHIPPPDPVECIGQKWKDGCSRGVRRCILDMGMKGI